MRIPKRWLWLCPLLLARAALAVDGVVEINQACAVNTGCLAGDAPGFPVELNEGGSYVLTSNITAPDVNTSLIEVDADELTLDLNGFALIGPTACTGTPVSGCGGGSGSGIFVVNDGTPVRNPTIRNGELRGIGYSCISMQFANGVRIEDVRVAHCGNIGIHLGHRAHLVRVVSESNGQGGIDLRSGARVEDTRAAYNSGQGINSEGDTIITGSSAIMNGNHGISCSNINADGCLVENTLAEGNTLTGVTVSASSIVRASRSTGNQIGVQVGDDSLVESCTLAGNSGAQLNFSAAAGGYVGNVITGGSLVTGSGVQLGGNLCNGVLCP